MPTRIGGAADAADAPKNRQPSRHQCRQEEMIRMLDTSYSIFPRSSKGVLRRRSQSADHRRRRREQLVRWYADSHEISTIVDPTAIFVPHR